MCYGTVNAEPVSPLPSSLYLVSPISGLLVVGRGFCSSRTCDPPIGQGEQAEASDMLSLVYIHQLIITRLALYYTIYYTIYCQFIFNLAISITITAANSFS